MSLKYRLRNKTGQTNYKKRLALLKSKRVRLVFRKTNTRLIAGFYQTPDPSNADLCVALFDSRTKENTKRNSKNQQGLNVLMERIKNHLIAHPQLSNYVVDVKNKRQSKAFLTCLHNP